MLKPSTLCFCVGATKASTSWLFNFLSRHPECHLRTIKELHFFDNLDAGRMAAQVARIRADIDRRSAEYQLLPRRWLARQIADAKAWLPVVQSGDTADYLNYLQDGMANAHLMADVTPSYSLLSVDRLRQMAGLMPDVRFVFLMRDPVARLWSHIRMSAWRQEGDLDVTAGGILDAFLMGEKADIAERGDYASVVRRLDQAIDPGRLLLMFQEVLLTLPGVQKLCSFLGLTGRDADFARRVHAGPNLAISPDQLARARVALRPQYEFAASRFGTLPAAWMRNMNEGVA